MNDEQYKEIMDLIAKIQDKKRAIIILETDDGGTDYLRYNLSIEEAAQIIKQAYLSSN